MSAKKSQLAKTFGKQFRALRVKKGYTQDEFARLLGLAGRSPLARWETPDESRRQVPHFAELVLEKARSIPQAKEYRAGVRGPKPKKKPRPK